MMVKIYHDAHPRNVRTSRGGSRVGASRGGSRGTDSSRNLTPPIPNPIDIRGEPEALALLSETLAEAGTSCD